MMITYRIREKLQFAMENVKKLRDDSNLTQEERKKTYHSIINGLFSAMHNNERIITYFEEMKNDSLELENEI